MSVSDKSDVTVHGNSFPSSTCIPKQCQLIVCVEENKNQ